MEKKAISQRSFKSTQTRCDNVYKKLKEEIEVLYLKRFELFNNIRFFTITREHEKARELDLKELNSARQEMLIDLVKINSEIENIVNKMTENHSKKVDSYLRWRESQKNINGFKIENIKTN